MTQRRQSDPSETSEQHPAQLTSRRKLLTAGGPVGIGLGVMGAAAVAGLSATPAQAEPAATSVQKPSTRVAWHDVSDHRLTLDGRTDCSAPLQKLIDRLDGDSATLYFPRGRYLLRSAVTIPASLAVRLDHGAELLPARDVAITINGPLVAEPTKIFGGQGRIDGDFCSGEVHPQWWGAIGDGEHDDTTAFQAALDLAKSAGGVSVFVPRGDYKLTSGLRIYRRTQFTMHVAATLVRHHDADFFLNGDPGENYAGYEGHGSIVISGGTLDGNVLAFPDAYVAMSFGHARDLTIRDLTIKDVSWGHAIEVNACRDVLISNCTFRGFLAPEDGTRYFSEAVQIDVPTDLSFPVFGAWDGTPSQDITVRDCYFGASDTEGVDAWPCAVGTHGAIHDVWTRGVTIVDNTFDQLTYWAVRLFKWNDCQVRGNTFLACGGGVTIFTPAPGSQSTKDKDGVQQNVAQAGARVQITDNVINTTTKYSGIGLYGQEGVYVDDTLIQNNQVHGVGASASAIRATWCRGLRVVGNLVSDARRGIHPENCQRVEVADNTAREIAVNALELINITFVNIAGNTISDCGFYGILGTKLTDLSITANWISTISLNTDSRYDGIILSDGSGPGDVRFNAVRIGTGQNRYGVNITDSCTEVWSSSNALEGKIAPYFNGSTSSGDQLDLYAPSGDRFRVVVDGDGQLSAVRVE